MTQRFIRDFELTIQIGDDAIVLKPPHKIVFDVVKTTGKQLNKASIQLFNLEESKRLRLVKDLKSNVQMPVILKVGYLEGIGVVFKGDIVEAKNAKKSTDYQTTIEALDGGHDYFTAYSNKAVRGNQAAVNELLKDMPNTQKGKVTGLPKLVRPKILVGHPTRLIEQSLEPNQEYFIDNGQLHIVNGDEVIDDLVPVVTASTGLMNTPEKSEKLTVFQTLMNPELKLGGLCDLVSATAAHLNGIQKIEAITYKGDSQGQNWSQTVSTTLAKDYIAI